MNRSFFFVALFATVLFSKLLADCGLNRYDSVVVFDSYAWIQDYPMGYTSRHPQKSSFSDAYNMNMSAPTMYPRRVGNYVGINDTLEVGVRFVNADTIPLVIKDHSVEAWVEPYVYQIGEKIESSYPLAGPPSVKWRVRYWRMPDGTHARPDTLFSKKNYIMKLDVWDLPEGKYQLAIMGTDSVPNWFDVMPRSDFYHMLPAKSMADSINAWATIFERVMADGNLEDAKSWLELILSYNSLSTVGFYESAQYYWQNDDSASTVANFDATLDRLDNWDDPALPDTTDVSYDNMNLKWKHFMVSHVTQQREMYINCPELR